MPIPRSATLPALLGAFLCLTAPARAASLNVPAQYPTIQAAITASQNGDTVLVADGTYSGDGNRDIDFGGKSLTVASVHGAASTVIDCGGTNTTDGAGNHRGFYLHSGETSAMIRGLTVKNGYENYVSTVANSGTGGGVFNGNIGGTIAVIKCNVSGNYANGGGGIYNHNDGSNGIGGTITLTDCAVSGNTVSNANGGGIYNHNDDINGNGGTITIANCTVIGNTASGGGGVYNANYANNNNGYHGIIMITNCTVSENAARFGGGVSNYDDNVSSNIRTITLANCIVYGDSGGEFKNDINTSSDAVTAYCDIQGGYPGTGNIDADPLFVSAALGNFHLQPGSPSLGAGAGTGAPATDRDGVTRPSPPSIGAYEATPSHTHLLWNNTDGRVMFWNVAADGSFTLSGFGPYTDDYVSLDPNNKWHATALAAAPDGTGRIVWNNVDHRVMLWSLDAQGNVLSVTGYGPYTDTSVSSSPANLWSAVGVSVGPDGLTHLLWGNTDRRMMFWDLDAQGNLLGLTGYGPYTDDYVSIDPGNVWSATALATGPDNVSRIVWNNVDHRVMLWTLGGLGGSSVRGIAGYGPYTDGAPNNLWSAVGVSVEPDNLTHLLWSNTDRRAMFWDVDSAFGFTLAGYGPYTDGAPQNLWTATALATGPDGLSHLLWSNTDNRAMLWGISSAFSFTVAGYGPYTDNAPGNLWSVTAVSAGP